MINWKFYELIEAIEKSKVDKLDVNKLVPLPTDLSKLNDAVKNGIAKKVVHNSKIKDIEDETPNITNLAINTTFNTEINDVKNETPSFTNLATTAALNAKIN